MDFKENSLENFDKKSVSSKSTKNEIKKAESKLKMKEKTTLNTLRLNDKEDDY